MPILRRNPPQGRYGKKRLDPTKPLYVARRIAGAHDPATGVQSYLVPGDVFVASSVSGRRLETLYAGRYISHDRPRFVSPVAMPAPADAPSPKGKSARGRV